MGTEIEVLQGAGASALPSGSRPSDGAQEVSTLTGFDPSREEQTIAAVMSAVALAFNPNGNHTVTSLDVVNACAALTAFIDASEEMPQRTLAQWKEDIGNLKLALGPNTRHPNTGRV